MSRSLRPRKSKVDYASLLELEGDSPPAEDDEGEFVPQETDVGRDGAEGQPSELSEAENDDEKLSEDDSAEQQLGTSTKSAKEATTRTPKGTSLGKRKLKGPGRPSSQKGSGAFDRRARIAPLFLRPAQVERLVEDPAPFEPSNIEPCNAWNSNAIVADKFTKAFAFNIGRGPAWELLEDRSWWRESVQVPGNELETEALRRPRVHQAIQVLPDLEVISPQ